jgi:hypothetical protein
VFYDYSNSGHACCVQRHVQLYFAFLYYSRTAAVDNQKSVLMIATSSSLYVAFLTRDVFSYKLLVIVMNVMHYLQRLVYHVLYATRCCM